MQGKSVPQDPNDESASVLLEKIRAEKQWLFEEGKLKKKDLVEIEPVLTDDNAYYGKVPINCCTPSIQNIGEVVTGNTPSKNMKSITMANIHSSNQLIYYREKIRFLQAKV